MAQLAAARELVRESFAARRFVRVALSLDRVAETARSLAPLITRTTGCRTLDLMHVATAKLLEAREFISADKRQIQAAKVCGLPTVALEAP